MYEGGALSGVWLCKMCVCVRCACARFVCVRCGGVVCACVRCAGARCACDVCVCEVGRVNCARVCYEWATTLSPHSVALWSSTSCLPFRPLSGLLVDLQVIQSSTPLSALVSPSGGVLGLDIRLPGSPSPRCKALLFLPQAQACQGKPHRGCPSPRLQAFLFPTDHALTQHVPHPPCLSPDRKALLFSPTDRASPQNIPRDSGFSPRRQALVVQPFCMPLSPLVAPDIVRWIKTCHIPSALHTVKPTCVQFSWALVISHPLCTSRCVKRSPHR